jgi:antirestriction protein
VSCKGQRSEQEKKMIRSAILKPTDSPQAWVGCLGCYNNGNLFGKWLPAAEADDLTAAGLATLENVGGYLAHRCVKCFGDEFQVFDHEGLEGFISGECSTLEAVNAAEFIEDLEKKRLDADAVRAWFSFSGEKMDSFDVSRFEDHYRGEWDTFEEYVQNYAEGCYSEELSKARWPFSCIDWEKAARELSYDYHTEDSPSGCVYVFSN